MNQDMSLPPGETEAQQFQDEEFEVEEVPEGEEAWYWAQKEAQDLSDVLLQKIQMWQTTSYGGLSLFSSMTAAFWRNTQAYYSPLITAQNWNTSLGFSGKLGEVVTAVVPRAKMLVEQFATLVTKESNGYQAITDTTDVNPLRTARTGTSIAQDFAETNKLDLMKWEIAEHIQLYGLVFWSCLWDDYAGAGMPTAQGTVFPGANVARYHDFYDVVWDWTSSDERLLDWVVLRVPQSRYTLAAANKEIRRNILSAPSVTQSRQKMPNMAFLQAYDNEDMVYLNYFLHKPTPALPEGRMMTFLDDGTVVQDWDHNPYGEIPGQFVMFQKISGTSLGYPSISSLLPAQELYDAQISCMATNMKAYGLSKVIVPRGANVSVDQSVGATAINYTPQNAEGGGKPEVLNLMPPTAEFQNFAGMLAEQQDQISLINDTLRGAAQPNVTSGTMAATLSSNALQFMNKAQKAILSGEEFIVNRAIKNMHKFGDEMQVVRIIGKNKTAQAQAFLASSLDTLYEVKVKRRSAMLSETWGRVALGEMMVNKGMIKDPRDLLELVDGAPIEAIFEGAVDTREAVRSEIDAIIDGQPVYPQITQNHPLYIKAYQNEMNNPYVQSKSQLMNVFTQLIEKRYALEQQLPPGLKAMLRDEPAPPEGMGAPMPGGGGGGTPMASQLNQKGSAGATPAMPLAEGA